MSNQIPHGKSEPPESVPDPNGGPVPVSQSTLETLVSVGLHVVAGGVAVCVIGAVLTPSVGATRSTRLLRDQRHQAVAEAIETLEMESRAGKTAMSKTTSSGDVAQ